MRKYEGLGVAELRRPKQLEDGSRKRENLVINLAINKEVLWDAMRRNSEDCPEARRGEVPV